MIELAILIFFLLFFLWRKLTAHFDWLRGQSPTGCGIRDLS